MGSEVKWVVVYEVPSIYEDWYYGITAQGAMEACCDNGPIGCKPLYAYREGEEDGHIWEWSGYDF